jgi:hypothetical protein
MGRNTKNYAVRRMTAENMEKSFERINCETLSFDL